MKKSTGILTLIVTVVLTALMIYVAVFGTGSEGSGSAKDIKLGLDLAGGVSITYGTVDPNPSAEDMADTIYKLQLRVQNYSTEAQVYQEGDNRINIEIPGVSDANAILEELGKPGSLQFIDTEGNIVLEGSDVADAKAGTTQDQMKNNQYIVALTLTSEGADKFAEATAANIGKQIAIIYDGAVVSAPVVQNVISDGSAMIQGMGSFEEADILASTIRIGSLSLELEELRSNVVGAQLGQDAISTSLKAGVIGFALVILFMIAFYLLPGVAASIALVVYTALVMLVLIWYNITLTLPGIAGIILGIGMAVDANVVIFARIREELATGKTVKSSVKLGFQKALSAILDGNITTFIVAIVLYLKASGSVKGFAQTLAIGIVVSMFTALVVTRLVLNAFFAIGAKSEKLYTRPMKDLKVIPFLQKKKIFFAVSALLIVIGFGAMAINAGGGKGALAYSLEFMGGTSTTVPFEQNYSIEEIETTIVPVVVEITGDSEVQTQKVSGSNDVIIKTKELSLETREALNQALADQFGVDANEISAENISSTISNEVRQDATVAVIIALILMLLYIWFRFKDIRFAGSAVLALAHDVLVVLAFYAVARISVGNTFIACMLTIVGYSVNATIVIFDRIRENLPGIRKQSDLENMVNTSITQTLSRSINTSLTTFMMVAVLFVLGVASIRDFALPLMVGILAGAWSSVCITGSLWYLMKTKIGAKN